MKRKVRLWEIAHSRAGDKGDVCNLSLIPYDERDFPALKREVTVERVKEHFRDVVRGKIERFELSNLCALNFVMHRALGGGVTRSLRLDAHGKSLSFALLNMEIEIDGE
jgi:hypothetical protein